MNDSSNKNDTAPIKSQHYDLSTLSPQKDEVALFELIAIILNEKFKIIIFTLLFIVAGVTVAYMLPNQWTSTAIVVKPSDESIQVLDKITSDLAALDIAIDIDSDYLLSTFKQNFDSRDMRAEYLVSTNYFKRLMEKNPQDELQRKYLIEKIINQDISSVSSQQDKADDKSEYRYYKLSHKAETASDAHDLLLGYINYVKKIVDADITRKIKRTIDTAKNLSTEKYNLDLLRAKNNQEVKIERLKYAIDMANAAGIKKPIYGSGTVINDDPDFPITIGSDTLNKKLEIEKSITDPVLIDPDLLNRKLYIEKLNGLKIDDIDIVPFKYLQQPTEPTIKDASKRLLVLILFTLIGFVGSVSFVLTKHFMREWKQKNQDTPIS
ncbi:LPS O-antigen length regulator Wzz(fepE) [Yersinia kristensenii]|uniref:LPS O-antigen length regulator Wzz(fepE) n=1 Tax=Yersinia kristensenii TaxID=28152 RepID=UPI0005EA679C|nr:LPS O-antigen length regulator Wzz(fepE) [Yersinia kristensenii]CFR23898.1 LPS O-antigen length regulator [Yersinia kristensenii]